MTPATPAKTGLHHVGWRRTGRSFKGLALTVVVVLTCIACGSDVTDSASSETPSSITAAPAPSPIELRAAVDDPEAIKAFEAVAAAYEAFNAGDIMTFAETYVDVDRSRFPDAYDNEVEYLEAARAAGARYDVAPCDYVGLIEAELDDDSRHTGVLVGHGFDCTTKMTDAFTIAAGIDFVDVWNWLVADEAVIVGGDYTTRNELRNFMASLLTWFRREHTDTNEIAVVTFYNYPLASDVPEVLAVLDQYVSERAE